MHSAFRNFYFLAVIVAWTWADGTVVAPAAVVPEVVNYPSYQTSYAVADAQTGDQKSASETRDGGVTKGEYSFVQPDGIIRRVVYTVTPTGGFQAQVINTGVSPHPASTNPKTTLGAPIKFTGVAAPVTAAVNSPVASVVPVAAPAVVPVAHSPLVRVAPLAYHIPIRYSVPPARLVPVRVYYRPVLPLPGFRVHASAGFRFGLGVGAHHGHHGHGHKYY